MNHMYYTQSFHRAFETGKDHTRSSHGRGNSFDISNKETCQARSNFGVGTSQSSRRKSSCRTPIVEYFPSSASSSSSRNTKRSSSSGARYIPSSASTPASDYFGNSSCSSDFATGVTDSVTAVSTASPHTSSDVRGGVPFEIFGAQCMFYGQPAPDTSESCALAHATQGG